MESTALLVGFVVMSIGSLALYATGSKDPAVRHHTQFHALVPFIAATSYLAMYLGTFVLTRADNVAIYVPRYADWAFTTPILLAHANDRDLPPPWWMPPEHPEGSPVA